MTQPAEQAGAVEALADRLALAGFAAAEEEAVLLWAHAAGDPVRLAELVERRLTGEPLAWILGSHRFGGLHLVIHPGVYVPRAQSEDLAERAKERLPASGVAVDLCTGSGAVAAALRAARPEARVIGTDLDPSAVACARANGVDAVLGDLFDPLPTQLLGRVDVVVGVVPYVPTEVLGLLARDHLAFESDRSYDGGPGGLDLLRRAVTGAGRWLRPGGVLLLELGGDQAEALAADLAGAGFGPGRTRRDEDGDVRGVEAVLGPDRSGRAPGPIR